MEVLLDIVVICSHFSIFETLETTQTLASRFPTVL